MQTWDVFHDGFHLGTVRAMGCLSALEAAFMKFKLHRDTLGVRVTKIKEPT